MMDTTSDYLNSIYTFVKMILMWLYVCENELFIKMFLLNQQVTIDMFKFTKSSSFNASW